jgi:RNA-directed DNA polymerase
VISLLLANIYLHVVLDEWFARDVQPRLNGRAQLVRYADDFVVICEREDDADEVMAVLPKRLGECGLTLHPEKTRMVRFKRPTRRPGEKREDSDTTAPQTFDFLGFTHHWGVSRKSTWYVNRSTAKARLTRALERIRAWCRAHRHDAVQEQQQALQKKMRGHYGYYGITGNSRGVSRYYWAVATTWCGWLRRRSQRARITWARFLRILARYPLPLPHMPLRKPTSVNLYSARAGCGSPACPDLWGPWVRKCPGLPEINRER